MVYYLAIEMSIFRSTTQDIQELRAIQTLMYCAPDITEKLKVGAPFSLPEPKFGTSYHYVYGWRTA